MMVARFPIAFWVLAAFVILAFLIGGSARSDIQSLIILRPVAVLVCGIGLWNLKREQVSANRFLFGMVGAIFALVLAHLVPLPPAIWHMLPGRSVIGDIDRLAFTDEVWRPLTMAPAASWNAFYSLFVPLAVLILGVQLDRDHLSKLVYVLLGIGLVSGFCGLLQIVSDPQGQLYFYRVTNNGSAVGLFANRNHQAMFLAMLIPLIVVAVNGGKGARLPDGIRVYVGIAAALLLVPLLLITGSRAGLILGVVSLGFVPALYRHSSGATPGSRRQWSSASGLRAMLVAVAILALGGLAFFMSRAEALQRLLANGSSDNRAQIWQVSAQILWKYLPFGSGIGSFIEIYKIDEPIETLDPVYVNHAHNDWLEIILTAGVPGAIMLAIACWVLVRSGFRAFGTTARTQPGNTTARLGAALIVMFALASIVDYPLRTPSLSCMFAIALLWLIGSPSGDEIDGTPIESKLTGRHSD